MEYQPELRFFWYDGDNGTYGREATYFLQVQALVMGAQEPAIAAARVNRYHPGRATAHVYPKLGHGIHVFASAEDSYHLRGGRYEPAVAVDVARWLDHAARGR